MRQTNGRIWWMAASAALVVASVALSRARPADPAPPAAQPTAPQATRSSDEPPGERLREGTALKSVSGTFEIIGERILFRPSERELSLPVLENLASERVAGMLDSAAGRIWSVSGTVTEFRGRNYLLVERAVIRARSVPAGARLRPDGS